MAALCIDCTSLRRERGEFNAPTWQKQGKIQQEMGDLSHLSQDTYCSCNTEGAVAVFIYISGNLGHSAKQNRKFKWYRSKIISWPGLQCGGALGAVSVSAELW